MTASSHRLLLLSATGFAVATTQAIVVPLTALYARELGASAGMIGAIVATGFLIPLFVAVRAGKLVDRFGAKPVLLLGTLLLLSSGLPALISPGIVTLTALMVLAHLGHSTSVVAAQSAVARLRGSREVSFGWFTTSVSAGQLVGPLLMGQAVEVYGFATGLALLTFTGLASFLLGLFTSSGPRPAERQGSAERVSVRKELPRFPGAVLAIGGSGSVLFVMGVHQAFYPVFLAELGVGASLIGLILALRAFAAILVRPFLPLSVRWAGSRGAVFLTSLLLCALGIALPVGIAPLVIAGVASLLVGLGSGLAQPLSMALIADHIPGRLQGAILGTRMAVNYVGVGSSTILIGAAIGMVGYSSAFFVSALIPAGMAVLVFRRLDLVNSSRASTTRTPDTSDPSSMT